MIYEESVYAKESSEPMRRNFAPVMALKGSFNIAFISCPLGKKKA